MFLCLLFGFSPVGGSIPVYIVHYVCLYILHGGFSRSLPALSWSRSNNVREIRMHGSLQDDVVIVSSRIRD